MRFVLLLLGLLALLPATALADPALGKTARALKPLVIKPMDAPAQCTLEYRSKPFWMKPGERIVETVIAGWIGTNAGITPESLRLGISSVYYDDETTTFAIIGLAFETEKDAEVAEKTLGERFAGKTDHRFTRRGPIVVVLAQPPPTNESCGKWVWEEIGRRLAKVAP
jgi:hypothetical protein